MANHKFVHVELSSHDVEAMKKFYGEVLGWTFTDFPEMNYTTFSTGEGELGGGFNNISEDYPAGTTLLYVHTDDIAASKNSVVAAGGTIKMDSLKIPMVGEMSIFTDPAGNDIALLQPEQEME